MSSFFLHTGKHLGIQALQTVAGADTARVLHHVNQVSLRGDDSVLAEPMQAIGLDPVAELLHAPVVQGKQIVVDEDSVDGKLTNQMVDLLEHAFDSSLSVSLYGVMAERATKRTRSRGVDRCKAWIIQ